MIKDRIEILERSYRFENRGIPSILLINPEHAAYLVEELGISPLDPLDEYHGMQVIIDESVEVELHSHASFQSKEYT